MLLTATEPGRNLARELWIRRWADSGRPVPPPHAYKEWVVFDYARRFGIGQLIETGTLHGDMIEACRRRFARIWSIELSPQLAAAAQARFQSWPHVAIVQGDSAAVLPELLPRVQGPCVFWLDGHFSGGVTARGEVDTPIMAEIATILGRGEAGDVLLIDDARLFGKGDYPTLAAVRSSVEGFQPARQVMVRDDIIRIHRPD